MAVVFTRVASTGVGNLAFTGTTAQSVGSSYQLGDS